MKKAWALLAIAVLLLAWSWRREGFEGTDTSETPEVRTGSRPAAGGSPTGPGSGVSPGTLAGPGPGPTTGTPTGPTGSTGPRGFDLYGPGYTERGSPYSSPQEPGSLGDGGRYPTLYGGVERQRAGQSGPTGPTLPSSASLGTDLGSMFLPYSRVPGDMDLIPDPFRAMNNFSLASYTPKTDPVPFLPDFSAFQK